MPVVVRPIWGVPRANRGKSHLNKALDFIVVFPLGTNLSRLQFQNWAIGAGYLPPAPVPPSGDLWTAFIQKRTYLIDAVRYGARSPLMRGQPSGPFRIVTRPQHMLQVLPLDDDHLVDPNRISDPIESLYGSLKRKFQEELQAAEWDKISPMTKFIAEDYYGDLESRARQMKILYAADVAKSQRHLAALQAERLRIASLPAPPAPPTPTPTPSPDNDEDDNGEDIF